MPKGHNYFSGHVNTVISLVVLVLVAIIGAVILLGVLSNQLPAFGSNVKNVTQNYSTIDWGNPTVNGVTPSLAILIALGGAFAILGLVFLAYTYFVK